MALLCSKTAPVVISGLVTAALEIVIAAATAGVKLAQVLGDVALDPLVHVLYPDVVCGVALAPAVADGPGAAAGGAQHHVLSAGAGHVQRTPGVSFTTARGTMVKPPPTSPRRFRHRIWPSISIDSVLK